MKRFIVLMLAAVTVLSLAACGGKKEEQAEPAEKAEQTEEEGEVLDFAAIGNPWIETDADEIEEKTGFRFTEPEGATDIVYRWNESIKLAEMLFTLDEVEWTARLRNCEKSMDITGLHYSWNADNYGYGLTSKFRDIEGEVRILEVEDGMTVNMGQWFDEETGRMMSISTTTAKGIKATSPIAAKVFVY